MLNDEVHTQIITTVLSDLKDVSRYDNKVQPGKGWEATQIRLKRQSRRIFVEVECQMAKLIRLVPPPQSLYCPIYLSCLLSTPRNGEELFMPLSSAHIPPLAWKCYEGTDKVSLVFPGIFPNKSLNQ